MLTPAITASSVSPPDLRISMARAQARRPFSLEMTIWRERVWAGAAASRADPARTARRVMDDISQLSHKNRGVRRAYPCSFLWLIHVLLGPEPILIHSKEIQCPPPVLPGLAAV